MLTLLTDLRSALAAFRRAPSFAVAVVATLALGIAPNCVIFSIMDAVYFKPLPYPRQEQLVLVNVSHPRKATLDEVDAFTFAEWQRRNSVAERMAAYRNAAVSLNWNDRPERVPGQLVTADFFAVLGVRPRLGRAFDEADQRPGAPPVVVLSHRTWQDYFSGRADVVGQSLRVNGSPATVVGVMPPEFVSFMEGRPARAWMPMTIAPGAAPDTGAAAGNVVARLKPGVSADSALAAMQSAHATLAAEHAEFYRDRAIAVRDFRSTLFGGLGPGIRMLAVLVGLVLVIACGNAANLLLARSVQRRREVAVRAALGARRPQLVRALLVESLALASMGAALGMLIAWWTVALLWSYTAPIFQVIGVDGLPFDRRVVAFAALLAAAVTVLFGALPSLRASRVDLVEALKDGTSGAGSGTRRRRVSRAVVVGQLALCVVTMMAAIVVVQSVARFASLAANPGFRPAAMLTATLPAAEGSAGSPARLAALDEIRARLADIPGVDAVALADRVPFLDAAVTSEVSLPTADAVAGAPQAFDAGVRAVAGDFFAVMSMPLVRGRAFTAGDNRNARPVAVVSDRLAAARWKGRDPIGDEITVAGLSRTVVGLVSSSVKATPFRPDAGEIFLPLSQAPAAGDVRLLVRSRRATEQVVPAIRAAVRAVDRDQPVADSRTLEEELDRFMIPFRLILGLTLAFSAVALLLAAVGLHGVLAHSVASRTREMGVRMALGASRAQVLRMVLGDGVRLALVGLAVGLLPGLALTLILPAALFGVGGLSALHAAAAMAVWVGVALAACIAPARRAAGVQPVAALRCE